MTNWKDCKKILCIRPDNMGDLLMSAPAMRALKEYTGCEITVLTSSMAAGIAKYIPEIDEVVIYDMPWAKNDNPVSEQSFTDMAAKLKGKNFDAAVVFTVYSQNPLPSVLLAYLAGIPKRLAYCRENPYGLLTDWVPDKEPYDFIQHQVRRDLKLVESIGSYTENEKLSLNLPDTWQEVKQKLEDSGADMRKPWMIMHAGVSEQKREYPAEYWIEAGKRIMNELGYTMLFTGAPTESRLAEHIADEIGPGAYSIAGQLSLEEFMVLIKNAPIVVSVNTGTIHIAAATQTPVVVLYALTNPQHSPWKVKGQVLLFDVPEEQRSKNEIVRYVNEKLHPQKMPMVQPEDVLNAVREILSGERDMLIPEMIPLRSDAKKVCQ